MSRLLIPRVSVLIAVIFLGLSFVATKTALRELSPTTLIFLRFACGVALLLAILHFRGRRITPPARSVPDLALMGFVGVFVHRLLQAFGLTRATAVHTGWLIGVIPLWSAILSGIFLKEQINPVNRCLACQLLPDERFIGGVIAAALYNLIAKWTGGFQFQLRDLAPAL